MAGNGVYIAGQKIGTDGSVSYPIVEIDKSFTRTTTTDTSGNIRTLYRDIDTWNFTRTNFYAAITFDYQNIYLCDDIYGTNYTSISYTDMNMDNVSIEEPYLVYRNSSNTSYCIKRSDYPYFSIGVQDTWSSFAAGYIVLYIFASNVTSLPGCSDGTIHLCGFGCYLKYNNKYLGFSGTSLYVSNLGGSVVTWSGNIPTKNNVSISESNVTQTTTDIVTADETTNINSYLTTATETSTIVSDTTYPVYIPEMYIISGNATTSYINVAQGTNLYLAYYSYSSRIQYINKTENVTSKYREIKGG